MKSNSNTYRILWGLIASVLLLIVLQGQCKFFSKPWLGGYFKPVSNPKWTLEKWVDGSFQEELSDYHLRHFGFRNRLVKLHNQLAYDCFDNIMATGICKTENNQFYQKKYFNHFTGQVFIDTLEVKAQTKALKVLQDSLEKDSIQLLFCIAPNKVDYYQDLLGHYPIGEYPRMYTSYRNAFEQEAVTCLDFNAWFKDLKTTEEGPFLFSNLGVHWSIYGASLAGDSILHYLYDKGYSNIPKMDREIYLSDTVYFPDFDMAQLMNIYTKLDHVPLKYSKRSPQAKQFETKMVVIGDSFWWTVWRPEYWNGLCPNLSFYLYGNKVYEDANWQDSVIDLSWQQKKERIKQSRVLLLLATEHNIKEMITTTLKIMNS